MKELKLNSKPWITPEIARMIKHRDNLFKRKKDNQIMIISDLFITYLEIGLIENLRNQKSLIKTLTLRIVNMIYRKPGMI